MILNKNYSLELVENNVILNFVEERLKLDKEGEEVIHLFRDRWYYPNLKIALKAFLNKSIYDTSIDNILKRIKEVEELILTIK